MRKAIIMIVALVLFGRAGVLHADIVIIANPDSGIERLSQNEAINVFMGRYRQLPSGITALPLDLTPAKAEFYQRLVRRTPAEINSYWARLVFSGQGSPPRQLSSTDEVLDVVANNRGAIGYVDRASVDARVIVVLELKP